ncbi:hypothetical protein [uncultured Bacteroides sp.]|uniref:hypothetical protein n=1 Tax=uncultured Bacteroides sp. TaxID=162156 RepID=UPI0025F45ECB|nr:hypothetical protein [uncultured Bacteroides sp.]
MPPIKQIHLRLTPESIHGTYGINYYFHTKAGSAQRLQFEVSVVYCGQYMEDYFIYHISKNEFVINRNESDEYLYDIAKKCAKVIYPVTVLIDSKGTPVYMRIDDIEERWIAARTEMDRYYKGEVAEQYLDNVENFLNNKTEWTRIITDDLFLSHLFSIFSQDEESSSFSNEIALIPFQTCLMFDCIQNIDKGSIKSQTSEVIHITREGITNMPYKSDMLYSRAKRPVEERAGQLSSKFKLKYGLEKSDMCVESIEGDFEISVNDKSFSTTRFTAFRLYEKPLSYGEDPYFAKMEKKQRRMDNSFWNKITRTFLK